MAINPRSLSDDEALNYIAGAMDLFATMAGRDGGGGGGSSSNANDSIGDARRKARLDKESFKTAEKIVKANKEYIDHIKDAAKNIDKAQGEEVEAFKKNLKNIQESFKDLSDKEREQQRETINIVNKTLSDFEGDLIVYQTAVEQASGAVGGLESAVEDFTETTQRTTKTWGKSLGDTLNEVRMSGGIGNFAKAGLAKLMMKHPLLAAAGAVGSGLKVLSDDIDTMIDSNMNFANVSGQIDEAMDSGMDFQAMAALNKQTTHMNYAMGGLAETLRVNREFSENNGQAYRGMFKNIAEATEKTALFSNAMYEGGGTLADVTDEQAAAFADSTVKLYKMGDSAEDVANLLKSFSKSTATITKLISARTASEKSGILIARQERVANLYSMGMLREQAVAAAEALEKMQGEKATDRLTQSAKMAASMAMLGMSGGAEYMDLRRKGGRATESEKERIRQLEAQVAERIAYQKGQYGTFSGEVVADAALENSGRTMEDLYQMVPLQEEIRDKLEEGKVSTQTLLGEANRATVDHYRIMKSHTEMMARWAAWDMGEESQQEVFGGIYASLTGKGGMNARGEVGEERRSEDLNAASTMLRNGTFDSELGGVRAGLKEGPDGSLVNLENILAMGDDDMDKHIQSKVDAINNNNKLSEDEKSVKIQEELSRAMSAFVASAERSEDHQQQLLDMNASEAKLLIRLMENKRHRETLTRAYRGVYGY